MASRSAFPSQVIDGLEPLARLGHMARGSRADVVVANLVRS